MLRKYNKIILDKLLNHAILTVKVKRAGRIPVLNRREIMTTPNHHIALTSDGYAKDACCGLNHSGNHGLVPFSRRAEHWQCQGCGTSYPRDQVLAPVAEEIGYGGVITR